MSPSAPEDVITIPAEGVIRAGESSFVYTVSGGRLNKQEVIVVASDGEGPRTVKGLSEGDHVVGTAFGWAALSEGREVSEMNLAKVVLEHPYLVLALACAVGVLGAWPVCCRRRNPLSTASPAAPRGGDLALSPLDEGADPLEIRLLAEHVIRDELHGSPGWAKSRSSEAITLPSRYRSTGISSPLRAFLSGLIGAIAKQNISAPAGRLTVEGAEIHFTLDSLSRG